MLHINIRALLSWQIEHTMLSWWIAVTLFLLPTWKSTVQCIHKHKITKNIKIFVYFNHTFKKHMGPLNPVSVKAVFYLPTLSDITENYNSDNCEIARVGLSENIVPSKVWFIFDTIIATHSRRTLEWRFKPRFFYLSWKLEIFLILVCMTMVRFRVLERVVLMLN